MITFHESQWAVYKLHAFPNGISPDQERMVKQAFCGGMLMIVNFHKMVPPDELWAVLETGLRQWMQKNPFQEFLE